MLILVDAVSCMAGGKIEFDAWGLDVCLAGTQKCFALRPIASKSGSGADI